MQFNSAKVSQADASSASMSMSNFSLISLGSGCDVSWFKVSSHRLKSSSTLPRVFWISLLLISSQKWLLIHLPEVKIPTQCMKRAPLMLGENRKVHQNGQSSHLLHGVSFRVYVGSQFFKDHFDTFKTSLALWVLTSYAKIKCTKKTQIFPEI